MPNEYIKLKKYVVILERPIFSVDRIEVATNNIKKTKKEYNFWTYIHHRKLDADDVPSI